MFDVAELIQAGGLLLITLIVFAESGMFVGFFFPGDTLLLSAGVFAAQGKLAPIFVVITLIAFAAILGDNIGYHIGKRYGRKLFRKKDGLIFRHEYVMRAEGFYERFGAKMMLIAHFVPIVRTFAPPVAGVAHMDYKKFVLYDAVGCISWAASITLLGYFVGTKIPDLDKYIHYAIIAVVAITLGPTVYHIAKAIWESKHKKTTDEEKKA